MQDVRSITDVANTIVSMLSEGRSNKSQGTTVPRSRILRLEALSKCSVTLCLSKLNVFWVEDSRAEFICLGDLEQAIKFSLQCPEFHSTCIMDSAYLGSLTGLFSRHLQQLSALSDEQRNYLVSKLVATSSLNSSHNGETSFACLVERNMERAVSELAHVLPFTARKLCKSLFSVQVDNLDIEYIQKVYESKLSISAKCLAVNDKDHVSLLSLECPVMDPSNGPKRSSVKMSHGYVVAGSAASVYNLGKGLASVIDPDGPAALVVTVRTELLADFASVASLYQVAKDNSKDNSLEAQVFEVKLSCRRLNIVMSSQRSLAVLRSVLSLYSQLIDISPALNNSDSHTEQSTGLRKSESAASNLEEVFYEKEESANLNADLGSHNLVSVECFGETIHTLVIVDRDLLTCATLRGSHVRLNLYANSDNQDIQLSVKDISVLDLSKSGRLHRSIVWTDKHESFPPKDRKQEKQELGSTGGANSSPRQNFPTREKSAEHSVIVLDSCRSNGKIQVNVRAISLRLVFLYRVVTEYSDLIAHHFVKSVSTLIKDVYPDNPGTLGSVDSSSKQVKTKGSNVSVSILLTELQGLIPRHSFSEDIIGLTLDKVHVAVGFIASSFPDPTKEVVESVAVSKTPWLYPLYFDLDANEWCEGGRGAFANSAAAHVDPDEDEYVTFYDTVGSVEEEEKLDEEVKNNHSSSVLRISIEAHGIEIFTSIPHASGVGKESNTQRRGMGTFLYPVSSEHTPYEAWFGEILDGQEVLKFPDVQGLRTWQKLSRSKLNLQVIVDVLSGRTRLLFGDTQAPSKLDLAVTQAELYLLMNLWFANINERPCYLNGEEATEAAADDDDTTGLDTTPRSNSIPFEDYGTIAYLSHYLERDVSFDLIVVRGELAAAIASDISYFPAMPDVLFPKDGLPDLDRSLLALTHERFMVGSASSGTGFGVKNSRDNRRNSMRLGPGSHRRVAPLAELGCLGIVLHVRMDHDVTQMSLSASLCEVYDLTQPQSKSLPLILRLAPHDDPTSHQHLNLREAEGVRREGSYSYGYCDFNYGFNQQPDAMELISDLPVKFSILLPTSSNWLTMNLGLDLVDLNLCQLEVVRIIADYFSSFFRFAEFGHPGLAEYYSIDSSKIPYGGIDLRLFITRPHLSLLDVHSPASLFVEAERGVYFRYILDTKSTVKMELNTYDLGVVLMRQYRAPEVSRGARGSSGSGRGIRTMVEFLNTIFRYSNVATEKQTDIQLEIYIPEDDIGVTESPSLVNLNLNDTNADPILIHEPTCLLPVLVSNKDFTPSSTNVVTSYEDIMFCWRLIERIISKRDASVDAEEPNRTSSADVTKTFYNVVVNGVRLLLVDNVLGLHLPLFQVVSILHFLFPFTSIFTVFIFSANRFLWSLYR